MAALTRARVHKADADLEQISREGVPRDVPELENSAATTCDVIYAATDT